MKKLLVIICFFLFTFLFLNNLAYARSECRYNGGDKWCIAFDGMIDADSCYSSIEECNRELGVAEGDCVVGSENFNYTKCYNLNNNHTVEGVYKTPAHLVNTLVNNLMIGGGLILFGMIIYSGFLMIKGGYKGFEEARGILVKAFLGLVVMFVAYWIVMIVGKLTGMEIFGIN
jgi:hypothetical protein